MIHWLIERAAVIINRHQVGHDGETLHKRAHQREAPPSQFEFGEQVLARLAPKIIHAKRKAALAPRFTQGTWVGVHEPTTENVVALQSGKAVRVRTVFRRPEEERWNLDRILGIPATLSDPNPATPGELITILKPESDGSTQSGKDVLGTPIQPRHASKSNFKLTKRIFENHGYTHGCVGCEALQPEGGRRSHSTYGRNRIVDEVTKSQEGRTILEDAKKRLADKNPDGEDDDNMFLPDHLDKDESGSDGVDSASEEGESGDKSLLAWIQGVTRHGCIAEGVQDILTRLEK